MKSRVPAIEILGIPIARLYPDRALEEMERLYESSSPAIVAYVNAHSLNLARVNERYRSALLEADLVLNDGAGIALAARMKGARFPANLNGSDLNPWILRRAAKHRWPVFFLGGRPGVAKRAAARLSRDIEGLEVVGSDHGYRSYAEQQQVVERVRSSGARLLMVALGNPRQEMWLHDHLGATGARLGVGVGAFLDFAAGLVPRAPRWMNRAGIEWVYRLVREPKRLSRRYLLGNPLFLLRAAGDAVATRR